MNEKIRTWLRMAPMPEFEAWVRSLYRDNILAVSRGGENVPAAFAEYGKKLMADMIIDQHRLAKSEPVRDTAIKSGTELLGQLRPANNQEG